MRRFSCKRNTNTVWIIVPQRSKCNIISFFHQAERNTQRSIKPVITNQIPQSTVVNRSAQQRMTPLPYALHRKLQGSIRRTRREILFTENRSNRIVQVFIHINHAAGRCIHLREILSRCNIRRLDKDIYRLPPVHLSLSGTDKESMMSFYPLIYVCVVTVSFNRCRC